MASKKHKKFLKAAKGFRNRRSRSFRVAFPAVLKAWQKAYVGRKLKKRRMKTQWIQQLNAGARMYGIGYAQFVHLAAKARIGLNRKVLADLAVSEPLSFKAVVDVCKHPS